MAKITWDMYKAALALIEKERCELRATYAALEHAYELGKITREQRMDGVEYHTRMRELDSLEDQYKRYWKEHGTFFRKKEKWAECMPQSANAPSWQRVSREQALTYQNGPLAQDMQSRELMRAPVRVEGQGTRSNPRKWSVLK